MWAPTTPPSRRCSRIVTPIPRGSNSRSRHGCCSTELTRSRSTSSRGGLQQYRSGDALAVDFNSGYNIGPWKLGMVGGYIQQYADDTVNGIKAFNAAGIQDGNCRRAV